MSLKSYDACLLCDVTRRGWVEGGADYPAHDCQLCGDHCDWVRHWSLLARRGTEDAAWRRYLVTQALARGAMPPRRPRWLDS